MLCIQNPSVLSDSIEGIPAAAGRSGPWLAVSKPMSSPCLKHASLRKFSIASIHASLQAAHALGLRLLAGTVNEPDQIARPI